MFQKLRIFLFEYFWRISSSVLKERTTGSALLKQDHIQREQNSKNKLLSKYTKVDAD